MKLHQERSPLQSLREKNDDNINKHKYDTFPATTMSSLSTEEEKEKNSKPPFIVYVIALSGSLTTTNVGFDIGVNSPAGILIQQDLGLADWQLEVFMGSINFFALFGALYSGSIIHCWGMKKSFLLASGIFLLGIIVIVMSDTFLKLLVGRIFLGLGVGFGFAITPQYIAEISPKQHRGFFTSWSEIGCNVGILLGFATGFVFRKISIGISWRLMFATGAILPVIMIILTFTVLLESPRWLLVHGKKQQSLQVLKKLYPNHCHDTIQSILDDIEVDMKRERQLKQTDEGLKWFLEHKPPPIRRMLRMGLGIAIAHEICGIDAIQYYLIFILQASGIVSRERQTLFLVLLGGLKLACLFVAMSFVDYWGRRPLLLVSVTGMLVSLLIIAINFFLAKDNDSLSMPVTIGGLALYLAMFSFGMGPLGWILPPELFSTTIRSKALSLTTFANRLTATFMTSTMLSIANWLSWGGYFLFLATINMVIFILAYWKIPETKGKKLEDTILYFEE